MACETPGKQLYDNLMDYDFVDLDSLESADVVDGKLILNKESYPCLIVPEAKAYPPSVKDILNRLVRMGLDVIAINHCPEDVSARVVALDNLAEDMLLHGYKHINATYNGGLTRYYHLQQKQGQVYMFFNESVTETSVLQMNAAGCTVSALDLLNQKHYTLPARDNKVSITLEPYQSIILFVGESQDYPLHEEFEMTQMNTDFVWDISLYDTVEEKVVKEYTNITELFNLNGYNACPNFTGKATYSTTFTLDGIEDNVQLRVFAEGQTVEVSVNGNATELKICNPFMFDISDKIHKGDNSLEITLCNTLANKIDEKYTAYLPIYAGGMIELPHIYIKKA